MSEAVELADTLRVGPGQIGVFVGDGAQNGNVMLVLDNAWCALEPPNAVAVALSMMEKAREISPGIAILVEKPVISPIQRMAMTQRVATIIRTFMDQKRTAGYIAQHCVDEVLRETAR